VKTETNVGITHANSFLTKEILHLAFVAHSLHKVAKLHLLALPCLFCLPGQPQNNFKIPEWIFSDI
jgi:hypothetical protein